MARFSRREFLRLAALAPIAGRIPAARPTPSQEPTVRTVAGTGTGGYEPEGLSGAVALATPVDNPYGIVPGPDGALYFCEVDTGRIRRLDIDAGLLSTVAGNGNGEGAGEGPAPGAVSVSAMATSLLAPHEIRFDGAGHLFVVERDGHVVRRIAADTRMVTTVAGTGEPGFSGDGGPAARARLSQPHSIAFTAEGDLLICDIGNHRVRLVELPGGGIRSVAGTGERGPTPDEAPLEGTPLLGPRSIDTDGDGNAYLALREGNAVFRLDIRAGRLQRIAGTGETGLAGDGGPAIEATFNGPKGIAYSAGDHSLYVVDTENHVIRRMDLGSGTIDTVLGTGERADGPDGDPRACGLARPHGVCVHRGIVYVTDSENHRVRALEGVAGT